MSVVRGWCPGALRPMDSGDGFVVRVRPRLGLLTRSQVAGLSELAATHGAGVIELTSRANLQLRGLTMQELPKVQDRLAGLGLLDPTLDPEREARVNILTSPFWMTTREWPRLDVPHLWHRLHAALLAPDAPVLPAKFGFALDVSPRTCHLHHDSADIRIESAWDDLIVRADGAPTGRRVDTADEAVTLALDIARWFVASGGVGADGRGRMRAHLARGARLPDHLGGDVTPSFMANRDLMMQLAIIGFDFGSAPAAAFGRLVHHMSDALRITPWRAVRIPMLVNRSALREDPDFIVSPHDPRHRRFACIGAPGCSQGLGDPRGLARENQLLPPPGKTLHISGCTKGCAYPGKADLVLTFMEPGLGMARNAHAGEDLIGTAAQARDFIQEVFFGNAHL